MIHQELEGLLPAGEKALSLDLIFIIPFRGNASFLLSLWIWFILYIKLYSLHGFQKVPAIFGGAKSQSGLPFSHYFYINVFVSPVITFVHITHHALCGWLSGAKGNCNSVPSVSTRMLLVSICCPFKFS